MSADDPQSISDEVYDESRYTPETRKIMDEHDQRRFHVIGLTDDALRRYALTEQILHDPAKQDHGYDRCEHCHYTRHPCSVHDLATAVLQLLDRGRPDSSWEGREPKGEYSGVEAEMFLRRTDPEG